MQRAGTIAEVRAHVAGFRAAGARIGFVPTMGNLHEGHHSLLELARGRCERVVASVFVNPTQFGPSEDFGRYPRTLESDAAALAERGCDLLFSPTVEEMYPFGAAGAVEIRVPSLSGILEGAVRPGHFDGVASVVARLFNIVSPDVAVFGLKDYQQFLVVQRMVRDLSMPIEIVGAPTVREPNGLARSSRNQYLGSDERAKARVIHDTLEAMAAQLRGGDGVPAVERAAQAALRSAGLIPDYAVVRSASDLSEALDGRQIALIAARLGTTRLIDNLLIDRVVDPKAAPAL
ncbi:MAG TPA: pantoate--beta-alanine ligase [Candidatus Saccharimonadia bacterium]|nr:pantoate--beta-alanine ligase [Candidatus Saccharimonadia bacterium]